MSRLGLCTISSYLLLCVAVNAQGQILNRIGSFIDMMSVRGLDRNYIDAPAKPWQIIVQGNINQSDLKMKSVVDGQELFGDDFGDITLEPRLKTKPSSYIGLWAGYRGYGLGYSKNVGGDNGSIFKIGATGGAYGVNLRIHNFKNDDPSSHISGFITGEWVEESSDYFLIKPIDVRTVIFDAYYMFNGKRFSYAAAYDQSVIQKRSAGSLMAGVMYYHSRVNYANAEDADFIMFMNDVGRFKQNQFSVGVGYAYNLVPCKGLLVSAMAMPMITPYNNIKAWKFDSLLRQLFLEQRKNPDEEDLDFSLFQIWQTEEVSKNGKLTLNFDARLSVTYNIGQWFVNAYGQFNTFDYHHGRSKGRLNDWFINTSLGIRL